MNANYGFTLMDVFKHHVKGTFEQVDTDRLQDYQDLLLLRIDIIEERIIRAKRFKVNLLEEGEDLRLLRRISDEVATILTVEFYEKQAA